MGGTGRSWYWENAGTGEGVGGEGSEECKMSGARAGAEQTRRTVATTDTAVLARAHSCCLAEQLGASLMDHLLTQ